MVNKHRYTIDLSPGMAYELDELKKQTGMTTACIFRNALHLAEQIHRAKMEGHKVHIVDPKTEQKVILEFLT